MVFVNATGKHPMVPACPNHKSIALIPENRYGHGGKEITGFWRCPEDNRVYIEQEIGMPSIR